MKHSTACMQGKPGAVQTEYALAGQDANNSDDNASGA